MKVSEIFYSVQGEGINAGKPAVFLRLAGCNLNCSFCDTKYANEYKAGVTMTIGELLVEIMKYPCKHVVITGGEPLLQAEEVSSLVGQLKLAGYYVEVETNGTIEPHNYNLSNGVDLWNVSPKLSNSKNVKKIVHYSYFNAPRRHAFFKFVVSQKSDIYEIDALIEKYHLVQNKIMLMPEGKTEDKMERNAKWIVEICKERNWRFTMRLHVWLWGKKRGV
jgi:7-carboxy-7-deazaguanine synthase